MSAKQRLARQEAEEDIDIPSVLDRPDVYFQGPVQPLSRRGQVYRQVADIHLSILQKYEGLRAGFSPSAQQALDRTLKALEETLHYAGVGARLAGYN